jgi:hypothetical protein
MTARFLVLCCVMWFAVSARAQDASVECDRSRDACDSQILEQCPAGADVLEEQQIASASGSKEPRYRITFRCRGGAAPLVGAEAGATAAPPAAAAAPAAAPQNSAENMAMRAELASVEGRLADLKAQRPGITGPIVLTAIGAAGMFIFTIAAIDLATGSEDHVDDYGNDVSGTHSTGGARVCGGLAVVSAGVTAGGLVWLFRRLKARRSSGPEYDELRSRERDLRSRLKYSFAVDPGQHMLLMRGSF